MAEERKGTGFHSFGASDVKSHTTQNYVRTGV